MVGNLTTQGQIVGTATFDGAKISAVVTIAPPINATVVFGRSGVSVHNLMTGRDAEDAHPIEAITGLTEVLETIPAPIGFTPENVANKKTTLTNSATDYPSTSAVNRLNELKQSDSPEFANTQITTLQSDATGGIIPAVEATWLGATAKSVLSYLQKLVSKVFAIDSRVAALENNVIIDVTLAVDTVNVTLTLPSTEEHVMLEYGSATGMNSNDGVASGLQINGVTTISYVSNTQRYNTVLFYTGRYAFFGTLEIMRINGYLFFVNTAQQIWGNTSTQTITGRFMQGYLGIAQPGVNSITIFGDYKAGTRFKLLRKK